MDEREPARPAPPSTPAAAAPSKRVKRAPIDREDAVDLRIDPPAAGDRRAHARRKLDTAPLPEFEERIGTGSVIDFLCAPFIALFSWWGGGAYAPDPSDRRELWLSVGFYLTIAVLVVARLL